MITVLSYPLTGTRFYLYFVMHILDLPVRNVHLFEDIDEVINSDDVIIVPVRDGHDYEHLDADRVHFMDIEKNDKTIDQFKALLDDIGAEWTPEVDDYIDKWKKIGSREAVKAVLYEGEIHSLTKWAVNRSDSRDEPPEPYRSWVAELLSPYERIDYWVGVITPDSPLDGDWVQGYPHTHCESVGWQHDTLTAVTYLAVPESGGEFGLGGLRKDDKYDFIEPEPGLTVLMDAVTWHGVKPVYSGTRISLITSATQ